MPDPVSRETPPAPTQATGVFASQLHRAEAYVELLGTAGIERGLIGPREVPRLWERHLLNCAVLSDLIPSGRSVADLGSGAGLPGLVLAIRRPDLTVTLVEPLLRRTQFLEDAVHALELTNVVIRRARAEELAGHEHFAVVTSRALAPLPRLLTWSLPLLSAGGQVLAIKGRSAEAEVEQLGLSAAARRHLEVVELGSAELLVPTTVVRVESDLGRHLPWEDSRGGARDRTAGHHRRRRR
jgi:16S rRNA (guanine527-N7)-methyltransferase